MYWFATTKINHSLSLDDIENAVIANLHCGYRVKFL